MPYRSAWGPLVCLFLLSPACSSPAGPTGVAASGGGTSGVEASELVGLTNAERGPAGLPAFTISPLLMQAAQIQADQMADLSQMAHVLPGARYPYPQDRLAAVGYQWQAYGENVACGQGSVASVIRAWMDSPDHRANILNEALTDLGTGFSRDARGRPYYVQVFGRPR